MKQTSMKLYFEGATGSVTGSCYRLEYSCGEENAQILVDCGLLQESEDDVKKVPTWNFAPSEIDAVLLTHAHADQVELLTYLFDNPKNPRTTPVQVILNHGAVASGLALAEKIDAFNAWLGENTPKTVVTSPFCDAFDLTGDVAEIITNKTCYEMSII